MLAGQRAFRGDTAVETMTAILKEEPPELTASHRICRPGSSGSCGTASRRSPEERFQSARDLAFDLEALGRAASSTATVVAPRRAGVGSGRPRGAGRTALAVLGVTPGRPTPEQPPPSFRHLTFRRGNILKAKFAPDGRTVVYSAAWKARRRSSSR